MNEIGEEFKNKSERYKELQSEIDHLSAKVKKLNEEYSQLSVKNEQLQTKLNKQADQTTNNQPLIQIKETITHLKVE
jgi:estrogen-related receptor beta like 1